MLDCSDDQKNIRDYYFPLKQLKEGLVYEYQAIAPDSLAPYYWFYRSIIEEDRVFLTGTYYEVDLIPKQFTQEELVENGMLLDTLILYYTDSTDRQQPIKVDIVAGNLFPFQVSLPSGVFLYNVHWQEPDDPTTTTTLIKNRRYLGDTTFVFQNKTYDCVVFDVKELVEVNQEGALEQQFSGIEFYAKGVGLVYTKRIINEHLSFEYALANRYQMDTLEQKFLERYQNFDRE